MDAKLVDANTEACCVVYSGTVADLEVDAHELFTFRGSRQGDVDTLLQAPPESLINVPREVGCC